jgi:hypothetical protein
VFLTQFLLKDWTKNKKISSTDHFGRSLMPLESLILVVLTIFGHGISFEIASWMISVSASVLRNFYSFSVEQTHEQRQGKMEPTNHFPSVTSEQKPLC